MGGRPPQRHRRRRGPGHRCRPGEQGSPHDARRAGGRHRRPRRALPGRSGWGISHLTERHELGSFRLEDCVEACAAGLVTATEDDGLTGRGLVLGLRRQESEHLHCAGTGSHGAQARQLLTFAGSGRTCFSHRLGRVGANLAARRAGRGAQVPSDQMPAALSWSGQSIIDELDAPKTGRAPVSPVPGDGTRGRVWRDEVSADMSERASLGATQALANYRASAAGARPGSGSGSPPSRPGAAQRRRSGWGRRPHPGRPPRSGSAAPRTTACPDSASCASRGVPAPRGGWSPPGGSTPTRPRCPWRRAVVGAGQRRDRRLPPPAPQPAPRHQVPVGLDLGVTHLAVAADADGTERRAWEGVDARRAAQSKLRRANKALARAKPGSKGRATARARITGLHARIANLRRDLAHRSSHQLASHLAVLTAEDLNVSGTGRLHTADRFYPSSESCSACGHVQQALPLAARAHRCDACGAVADRDHDAAVNPARWPARTAQTAHPAGASPPSRVCTATRAGRADRHPCPRPRPGPGPRIGTGTTPAGRPDGTRAPHPRRPLPRSAGAPKGTLAVRHCPRRGCRARRRPVPRPALRARRQSPPADRRGTGRAPRRGWAGACSGARSSLAP